jgi:hypothetical protein
MRKKQLVISISLVMTVLFSILFQSLHTYAHFVKQFAEKECHHKKNNYGEPEITHQHHTVDDCKVCHFTFGSYITPKVITYKLILNYKQLPYFDGAPEGNILFSGSMYAHRGPPSFAV